MIGMTIDQLIALMTNPKCSQCEEKAVWFIHKDLPAYCDRHFPDQERVKEETGKNGNEEYS